MSASAHAQPVGGTLWTRPYKLVLALAALGLGLVAWRFAVGLGASTDLSDGYPWGLWIAFDVVTGTALACGGYAMAIVVYVLNRGRYHPLVRPAVLTSALGYSIAGFSILIDVGRPWHVWKVPLFFWEWNLNSALLEIALCVMAYVGVLWIELSPALLERWKENGPVRLRAFAARALPILDRGLVWILALGILLPTMHQSSLGTLILLSGPKLHPLWNTPLLPLLFLMTAFAMGYAAVVMESALSSVAFRRPAETGMLATVERAAVWVALAFVALRLADLAWRGDLDAAFVPGLEAAFFWLENLLFVLPFLALLGRRRPAGAEDAGRLFRGALFLILAGGLFRFDAYLLAFDPGPGWHYFPSAAELLVTVGLVALEVAVYIALVKKLPILGGARPASAAPART